MRNISRLLLTTLSLISLFINCGVSETDEFLAPGVSWELAEYRYRSLSDIRYELVMTIPTTVEESILGTVVIRFQLHEMDHPLAIDFNLPAENVKSVSSKNERLDYSVLNGHVVIPESELRKGENAVSIEFIAGDGSLNRNPDFLYTLFVPDRARFAFPCFDQPNLKARYSLTLTVPEGWTAISNSPLDEKISAPSDERAEVTYKFAESEPISTYLFAFAAGLFQAESEERGGRLMTMYHRETDPDAVDRNLKAIFDLHETALYWLEQYTGIPYPFKKFDFVLIPSFQYGGMEHPGSIFYRQNRLILDESATQNDFLGRAGLISHETAHMWFGDLVTMNWFDDVWTKEVFANFMAARIVNPSFPEINHDLRFLLSHYPSAYAIDRTEGANPIRQELENLQMAGTLYGAIIYQKSPIVMRQLEQLIGAETFREGLQIYLQKFQFGNATWPELIEILDDLSKEDLKTWSEVWVQEPGRPKIETLIKIDAKRRISELKLVQFDPQGRQRRWIQNLEVLFGYSGTVERFPVKLENEMVEVTEAIGKPLPDFILANGGSRGYGFFVLDENSQNFLIQSLSISVEDPLVRGIAWISLWEAMLHGQVDPKEIVDLAVSCLKSETDELNITRILSYLRTAYWRFTSPKARIQLAPTLESVCWDLMGKAETSTLKAVYFNTYRSIALSDEGIQNLRAIWERTQNVEGLVLSENDFTALSQELAVRDMEDAEDILDKQSVLIKNPDKRARFDFIRPALSRDISIRNAFFESLKNEANREHEPWVLTGLRYLHHPLRTSISVRYIPQSLELLTEIQRTGDIFFPKGWLDATLGGHRSITAAEQVRSFLHDYPDLSPRLKGKVLQSADELFRASLIED